MSILEMLILFDTIFLLIVLAVFFFLYLRNGNVKNKKTHVREDLKKIKEQIISKD